jgi:hypothetical protein
MDKRNLVYSCNGILVRLKKEGNLATCNNLDESWGRYAKRNKPVTRKTNTV